MADAHSQRCQCVTGAFSVSLPVSNGASTVSLRKRWLWCISDLTTLKATEITNTSTQLFSKYHSL